MRRIRKKVSKTARRTPKRAGSASTSADLTPPEAIRAPKAEGRTIKTKDRAAATDRTSAGAGRRTQTAERIEKAAAKPKAPLKTTAARRPAKAVPKKRKAAQRFQTEPKAAPIEQPGPAERPGARPKAGRHPAPPKVTPPATSPEAAPLEANAIPVPPRASPAAPPPKAFAKTAPPEAVPPDAPTVAAPAAEPVVTPTAMPPVEQPKAAPVRTRRRAAAVDEAREAEALRRPVRRRTRRSDHPGDFDFVRLNVPCQWACPVLTDVPDYIFAIAGGDRDKSYLINRATNLIPGVLGHVCSRPCEAACRHGEPDLGEPVAICHLKRVAADFRNQDHPWPDRLFPDSGCTVGVVGGGPAGLAAAQLLAALGHGVTVYETMPRLGGMLMYGIPVFRLPRELVEAEIGRLLDSGIAVKTGVRVGHDITVPELLARHRAVVLATGTCLARGLAIPGGDLPGVYSGLDFMMDVNDGRPPVVGRRVVTIGGGFTAHDCARSVLRLGAAESYLCVRTTEEDLWVTREEVLETKREGVRYLNLVSSMRVAGADRVEGVVFARNRLGPVGKFGQRTPVAIEDSEFVFAADTVIAATGQYADTAVAAGAAGAAPRFDPRSGACAVPGLFAAGDFCTGAATVIEAMGHARRVAQAVDEYLTGARRLRRVVRVRPAADTPRPRAWDFIPRADMPMLAVPQRLAAFGAVVKTGFPAPVGERESHRCYLCHMKYEIRPADCIACGLCAAVCPRDCIGPAAAAGPGMPPVWADRWDEAAAVVIDSARCIRCGLCLRVCPTRCIEVERVEIADVTAGE